MTQRQGFPKMDVAKENRGEKKKTKKKQKTMGQLEQ